MLSKVEDNLMTRTHSNMVGTKIELFQLCDDICRGVPADIRMVDMCFCTYFSIIWSARAGNRDDLTVFYNIRFASKEIPAQTPSPNHHLGGQTR